jgi:transcriptional regulator with XRE-family HTH domain
VTRNFVDELLTSGLKNDAFREFYSQGGLRRALASALVRIRKAAGLTQSALGDKVGWKQPYVTRLERGDSDALAAMERVGRFASACGVSTILIFADRSARVLGSVAISRDDHTNELARNLEGETIASPLRIDEATLGDIVALESKASEVAKRAAQVKASFEARAERAR